MMVPNHVAVILDGNRRWSRSHNMEPWEGYSVGADKFVQFAGWCSQAGIKQISAYVMSTENLNRPKREINEITNVIMKKIVSLLDSDLLRKYEIRVKFLGDLKKFPSDTVGMMRKMMRKTARFTKLVINILVGYSGKTEIVNAMRNLIRTTLSRGISITEKSVQKSLLVKTPVDLVIRAGGHSRLSNFLIWQTAYAEMYVTNTLWPDFSKKEFNKALRFFSSQQRNFGL